MPCIYLYIRGLVSYGCVSGERSFESVMCVCVSVYAYWLGFSVCVCVHVCRHRFASIWIYTCVCVCVFWMRPFNQAWVLLPAHALICLNQHNTPHCHDNKGQGAWRCWVPYKPPNHLTHSHTWCFHTNNLSTAWNHSPYRPLHDLHCYTSWFRFNTEQV